MRRNFLTGLAVILPLLLTVYVVILIFSVVGGPLGTVFAMLRLSEPVATAAGFLTTIMLITLAGFIASNVIGRQLLLMLDTFFQSIPLIKSIYLPTKQLVNFLFSDKTKGFKRVAMVEYPRKGVFTLGFVTGEEIPEINSLTGEPMMNLFLPTTPNPTSGWLLLVPSREVVLLQMSVEDAMKLIVSGGVLMPEEPDIAGQTAACQSASG